MKLPRRCVTHCDSSSSSLYPSISRRKVRWRTDSHSTWNLTKYGVCPLSLSFPLPPSLATGFYFFSRWEAFRVLPLAESLTNVALKCNEVWNGSCGYNYPRTGAVTGMISLSLAIRISYEWGRARRRGRDGEIGWQAVMPRSYMTVWRQESKQEVSSWKEGGLFSATELHLHILYVCAYLSFKLEWLSFTEYAYNNCKAGINLY